MIQETEPKDARAVLDSDEFARERLISARPVIVRRRVLWGECDPAGVVYTPRFSDYIVAAYDWFQKTVVADALSVDPQHRYITPMKAFALEFHRVLRPNDLFDMTVGITQIRTRTFDLLVSARSLDGLLHFRGRVSPILCRPDFQSVALTEPLRQALQAYQCEHGTCEASK